MKMKKALILPIIVSMLLGVVMVSPVGAQLTTIGVEPASTIDLGLGPGSTFTVEVWIRNVEDLVGVELKLGYDTTVLTATNIAYGGIFGPSYFPLISAIYDADGYLIYAFMEAMGEPPFSGDGKVATITFSVDSVGESALDLYDTKLGDTSLPLPKPIPHATLDGYFRNALLSATLLRRKAWPEHHNFEILWDEDDSNDLYAIVKNDGDVDTWVKVVFTVVDSTGIPIGDFETDTILLPVGGMYGETKYNRYKAAFVVPGLGKYYVSAVCWADTDGDTVPDTAMGTPKSFAFRVVWELLD